MTIVNRKIISHGLRALNGTEYTPLRHVVLTGTQTVLVLSDLHLNPKWPLSYLKQLKLLRQLRQAINDQTLIVLAGDILDFWISRPDEIFSDPFVIRVFNLLNDYRHTYWLTGNHDAAILANAHRLPVNCILANTLLLQKASKYFLIKHGHNGFNPKGEIVTADPYNNISSNNPCLGERLVNWSSWLSVRKLPIIGDLRVFDPVKFQDYAFGAHLGVEFFLWLDRFKPAALPEELKAVYGKYLRWWYHFKVECYVESILQDIDFLRQKKPALTTTKLHIIFGHLHEKHLDLMFFLIRRLLYKRLLEKGINPENVELVINHSWVGDNSHSTVISNEGIVFSSFIKSISSREGPLTNQAHIIEMFLTQQGGSP